MKERLDVLLVRQGLAESREKAKAVIMAGCVYVNDQKEDKAGAMFDETKVSLEVRGSTLRYVSRGGLKLEKAVEAFGIALRYVSRGGLKLEKAIGSFDVCLDGSVCMDIGASTGGFTDCMLQNGARKVYAVDVGHGQLAWKLRNDERVVCMEKTNFRYMVPEDIEDRLDFASVDVSFISLDKILGPAHRLLKPNAQMVCLIKPQFEAGKEKVGKKGVVRDPQVHTEVIRSVFIIALERGFEIRSLDFSPIRGPEGNIEYLMHLLRVEPGEEDFDAAGLVDDCYMRLIGETVSSAHKALDV